MAAADHGPRGTIRLADARCDDTDRKLLFVSHPQRYLFDIGQRLHRLHQEFFLSFPAECLARRRAAVSQRADPPALSGSDEMRDAVLDALEAEAIWAMRETAAAFRNPVMLYSIGKDSGVMLHLAARASRRCSPLSSNVRAHQPSSRSRRTRSGGSQG